MVRPPEKNTVFTGSIVAQSWTRMPIILSHGGTR